ncbi:nucleotide sugar dehydrogenase, partial [Ferroplasma acidiphilum]
ESVNEINKTTIIAIKSTVVPGTASALSKLINKNIVSNPEFLREGSAIYDTLNPDRIVVGGKNKYDIEKISSIWEFTKAPVIKTTNENAELIKYASNSFLAVKISFINEISNLCEKIPDTDVNVIAKGIGLDHRIGKEFLKAGIGFGGSCFPKDTRAILAYAKEKSVDLSIISAAINVNNDRINKSIELIGKTIGNFKDKKILLLGLSFKNDTNDLRESKAVELANALTLKGSIVDAYDPIVKEYNGINVLKNLDDDKKYDCIIITSEWEDFKDNNIYKNNNVIDLRRIVDLGFYPNVKAIGVGYD